MKEALLDKNRDITDFISGKNANKARICEEFGFDLTLPLFIFIGRLEPEKGADLLASVLYKSMLKKDCSLFILGEGKGAIASELKSLRYHFNQNYTFFQGFNEVLAHQLYAGADFLLMPSRIEPCGLNQMYALRYGTIPIVRRTGGLNDSVIDIGDGGFGICHVQASVKDICDSMERGKELYRNKKELERIIKKSMRIDYSWDKSAQEYLTLYKSLTP